MNIKEIKERFDELANLIKMKYTSGITNSKYVREAVILIQSQQKRIEELELAFKQLSEVQQKDCSDAYDLEERKQLVLNTLDKNEKMNYFTISTYTVRSLLTDYPINQIK